MVKENTIKVLRILAASSSHKEPIGTHQLTQDFKQVERVTAGELLAMSQLLTRLMRLGLVAKTTEGWYILRYGREEITRYDNQQKANDNS